MKKIKTNKKEKRSPAWQLTIALIIISLVIYWVINAIVEQERPQVRNSKIMQIMV